MRINYNGVYRDLTAEEITERERMLKEIDDHEPSLSERNRADIDYLLMLMEG